jgi:glycerol-3-phosphate dehydrogenase
VADPEGVRCTEEEADYCLELVRRVFPGIVVERSHIVFRFSGVRPLAASGLKTTGQITRDHEIRALPAGVAGLPFPIYSLVGGKWTSWRAFSEQAADKCLDQLGIARQMHTRGLKIGGGQSFRPTNEPTIIERLAGVRSSVSGRAAERYGRGRWKGRVRAGAEAPMRPAGYSRGKVPSAATAGRSSI